MTATVAGIHGGLDIHANRPAGNAVPDGSLYSCSTHGLIYKSNLAGNSWATYATLGSSGSVATDTIWDNAGDLAVGSGADTAAKLAIGAAGGALSRVNGAVAWNSGTSFPSAATGDRYWRTDRGQEFWYDGTQWRSTDVRQLTFTWRDGAAGAGLIGSVNAGRAAIPWQGTFTLYLMTLHLFVNAQATNSGSHYMTIKLNRADVSDADTQIGSTLDTSGDTAGQNNYKSLAINAALNSGAKELKIRLDTGAGSPGGVILNGHIDYQLIMT